MFGFVADALTYMPRPRIPANSYEELHLKVWAKS